MLSIDQDHTLTPREQLQQQFEVVLMHFLEVREFLLNRWNEEAGINQFCFNELVNRQGPLLKWIRDKLVSVYGEEIAPYTLEITMTIGGLFGSYMHFMFVPVVHLNIRRTSAHMMQLLDDIVSSIFIRKPEPLVPLNLLLDAPQEATHSAELRHPLTVLHMLERLIRPFLVTMVPGHAESTTLLMLRDLLDSLEVLEQEVMALKPNRTIVRGMIANMRETLRHWDTIEQAQEIDIETIQDVYKLSVELCETILITLKIFTPQDTVLRKANGGGEQV
jgi:hypothetical protein